MLSDYFLTTSPLSMTEEERFNVAGMRASWKAIAQEKTNAYELKFHQICSSVFHRTLRPSGTPLYFSPTRPQKNCWPNSLQPLSSPLSLTCSSQVLCCLQILLLFSATFFGIPRDRTLCGETSKSRVIGGLLLHARFSKPKKWGVVFMYRNIFKNYFWASLVLPFWCTVVMVQQCGKFPQNIDFKLNDSLLGPKRANLVLLPSIQFSQSVW